GYTITITEYRPFMVGIDRCGDNRIIGDGSHTQKDDLGRLALDPTGVPPDAGEYSEYPYILGPDTNRYYWTVHVANARLTWFRLGNGGRQTGLDPHLRIGLGEDLECLVNRWKPAHTTIIFDYSGLSVGVPIARTPWSEIMKYNPPYGLTDPNAPYVNGDPSIGRAGSIPPAESIEYPQREIANLITDVGIAPTNSDLHQVARAIQSGQLLYAADTGTATAYSI